MHFNKFFILYLALHIVTLKKIETQGKIGDRKCDGYKIGEGVFYQVYGPKDYTANSKVITSAISKMETDFYGLKKHVENGHWETIKEYIFVFKTHRGTYPDLIDACNKLSQKNPNVKLVLCQEKVQIKFG